MLASLVTSSAYRVGRSLLYQLVVELLKVDLHLQQVLPDIGLVADRVKER